VKRDPTIAIATCKGIYPPSEDTHLLLSAIQVNAGQRVLEMGTGTGIIALHCARAGCRVVAADISQAAADNARMNAQHNRLDIEIIRSDMFENIRGVFDAIIFNPPYLSAEGAEGLSDAERRPLVGGRGGHEATVRFLEDAGGFLAPGGRIYLLTSSESEAAVLKAARECYYVKLLAEQRVFFEVLAVWELRLGKH
jgi:release factor glutamine methyltransferase